MAPPPPPPSPAAPPGQKLTTNDAIVYLKVVKDKFQDKRDKYEEFKQVLCDFNSGRIDADGVIGRVKTLLSGHPELILGFKGFLPKGCEAKLQDLENEPDKVTNVVNFVQKIKIRFQPEDQVYKSFVGILMQCYNSTQDACKEVAALLHDHPDLLVEARHNFLPDTDTSTGPQVVTATRGVSAKHGSRNPIMPSSSNVQSIPGSPTHMSPPSMPLPVAPSGQKHTTNDALMYLKAVKETFQDKRDKYEEFLAILDDFCCRRISTDAVIIHVKTLFSEHPELILGLNVFLPSGYKIKLQDLEMKPAGFMQKLLSKINV